MIFCSKKDIIHRFWRAAAALAVSAGMAGIISMSAWADPGVARGEVIGYSIKKLGIKAGNATLTFNGLVHRQGKNLLLITFTADGFNFFDEERIYFDPQTLYPQFVDRDLNIFGKKEKITEVYSQDQGIIEVIKEANGKIEKEVLHRPAPVDNIYCFIYRYRMGKAAPTGDIYLHLPTKDVRFASSERTSVKAKGQEWDAVLLESDAGEYRVWFDQSRDRVPLRIDGATGFGKTAMIMNEYKRK